MPEIVMFHDLVEKNGKTIRENNLDKTHRFPLGALVRTEVHVEGAYRSKVSCDRAKVTLDLYVVEHTRDCDGSLMYTFGTHPFPPPKGEKDVFAPTYFGRLSPVYYSNYGEDYHDIQLLDDTGEFWSSHRAYWIEQLRSCQ
ncbi:MAG: hypothetical protein BWY82_02543 [Verrucomicrobia bacterium ADurb.Bin474]|nr:MAG: hypothetical protein BWY82_02543 [Verrucomicrobia bacterium ADurb.Bin474]